MPIPIRIDATTLPALICGGVLLVIAALMAFFVWRSRHTLDPALENDDVSRLHADRQFRRRMQVSGLLAVVGFLIPFGDQCEPLMKWRPALFFLWILVVFILVLWMVVMALGDWVSTMAYSAVARSKLRHQRTELEEEIRRYHASKNGHHYAAGESDEF